MRSALRFLIPILILAIAAAAAAAMISLRPEPESREPIVAVPLVRIQTVELQDLALSVMSQGTVRPRTESVVVAEVSGRIVEVGQAFVDGGFFEKGDLLYRIDPVDYRQAVVQAQAQIAQARVRLESEQAEAELAVKEWNELGLEGTPSTLTTRKLQQQEAQAILEAAQAAIARAERDLERTEVRTPYAGIVRSRSADFGQFVSRGQQTASIYSIDDAEIRLPLPDSELAFLDLPMSYRGARRGASGPQVELTAEFAGATHRWQGRVVRTEGEIDPSTRMVHAVARVKNPYARGANPKRPPLAVGMYVRAKISGTALAQVAIIDRAALRGDSQLLIIDAESKLRFRDVEVVRLQQNEAIIGAGLNNGDRVCLSPLGVVTDGMAVTVTEEGT